MYIHAKSVQRANYVERTRSTPVASVIVIIVLLLSLL